MRFQGRIALITAAGRGIGRATAEIIGREGGTVIAVELDKESLDQVVGAIRAAGGSAHGLVADALDASQVAGVMRRIIDEQCFKIQPMQAAVRNHDDTGAGLHQRARRSDQHLI